MIEMPREIWVYSRNGKLEARPPSKPPQVDEVTVDQLVLRFKLTNAEYLINQLSFDHPHGIRIIREKSDA